MPTLTETSRFDEPSSGSKTTQYFPPSAPRRRIVGSSSSSEATTATVAAVAEARHQDVVGDDVELLLRLAVDVGAAVVAEHVFDAGVAHLGGDRLGGERERRQDPGQVARGRRVARFLVEDV